MKFLNFRTKLLVFLEMPLDDTGKPFRQFLLVAWYMSQPNRIFLHGGLLLDPEAPAAAEGALLVVDGRIAERRDTGAEAPGDALCVDLAGRALAPGFLDLHYHGALIFEAADAPPEALAQRLARTAQRLLRDGVTGFLPTTVAWPAPELRTRVAALARACEAAGGSVLGLHLEGPWINPGAAGAQPRPGIRPFEAAEGAALLDCAESLVRVVTFAPEMEGAAALQAELARRGIVAALGHSLAQAEQVARAVAGGASHVTHLFNAMGGMHHRAPGLAGAALAEDRLSCDLICDGLHVDPQMVRLAARAKGGGLALITDRIELPGAAHGGAMADASAPGTASSSATPATSAPGAALAGFGSGALHDDGRAIWLRAAADSSSVTGNAAGARGNAPAAPAAAATAAPHAAPDAAPAAKLAGSSLSMDRAVRNATAFGAMSQLEAVAAATLRPARILGIESRRGTLRPGARADFAILNSAGVPVETWLAGRRVWSAQPQPD